MSDLTLQEYIDANGFNVAWPDPNTQGRLTLGYFGECENCSTLILGPNSGIVSLRDDETNRRVLESKSVAILIGVPEDKLVVWSDALGMAVCSDCYDREGG